MPDPLATACALVDPLPVGDRTTLLICWADRLERQAEAVARSITEATRKPIRLAREEVGRAIGTIRATAASMDQLEPQVLPMDGHHHAEIYQVPLGPVLAVTPFNFPLNLAVHKIAPALAAGCSVIWKPSPQAAGVAELVLGLLLSAGCPPGVVQIAALDNLAVEAMAQDERLAVLSFTGSAPVGHRLQSLARRAKVILELGGNAAVILHQLDDIRQVASDIAASACAHAGQVCISTQRIFYPEAHGAWLDALVEAFRSVPTGDPQDERTVCGPVISSAARSRIELLLERYRVQGGRILCGGTWDGLVLAPTLVAGLSAVAPGVYDTEAFAPLATVHPYGDIDGALHLAELTPFGLQAGIFTHDEAVVQQAFRQLQVGTLVVNDVPSRRNDALPYGGMKESGCGREGTRASLLDYTQPKVLWRRG